MVRIQTDYLLEKLSSKDDISNKCLVSSILYYSIATLVYSSAKRRSYQFEYNWL
jgi:hypothetical protein